MAKTGSSTSSDASKVSTCEPKIEGEGKAFCRCEEGWTCVITKTKGPDAGKMFFKCGEGCTCVSVTDAGITTSISSPEGFGGLGGGKVFCKCEDGWACEIYRTEAPDADVDAGYTVDDYVNAPAYGGVAALDVQAGEDEHDASCECPFCVYL